MAGFELSTEGIRRPGNARHRAPRVGRLSPADAEQGRPDRAPHNPSKIATPRNAREFSNSPWTGWLVRLRSHGTPQRLLERPLQNARHNSPRVEVLLDQRASLAAMVFVVSFGGAESGGGF